MREIKFRAYIEALNLMLPVVSVYSDGMVGLNEEEFLELIKGKFTLSEDTIYDKDDSHVMNVLVGDDWIWFETEQCEATEFFSIHNGSEIYEGDILEVIKAPLSENHAIGLKFKVELHNGEINFYPNNSAWRYNKLGNVHQNPDLINHPSPNA